MDETTSFPVAPRPFDGASRRVDPGASFEWLRQGWSLFAANPGVWMAATVLALVIFLGLSIVPLIGQLAANLLSPVFAAGLVHLARRQAEGEVIAIGDLFAGFQSRTGPLVVLGALYAVALLAVTAVVFLVAGGSMAGGMMGMMGGHPAAIGMGLGVMFGGMLLAALLAAALLTPVVMAMWFAPLLVFFNAMEPVPAMKASFSACLANWLAFLVYGVILLVLFFFAALPLGLGFLVLVPVLAGAQYASYRDVFPGS